MEEEVDLSIEDELRAALVATLERAVRAEKLAARWESIALGFRDVLRQLGVMAKLDKPELPRGVRGLRVVK